MKKLFPVETQFKALFIYGKSMQKQTDCQHDENEESNQCVLEVSFR
jgi:hypothetical protein